MSNSNSAAYPLKIKIKLIYVHRNAYTTLNSFKSAEMLQNQINYPRASNKYNIHAFINISPNYSVLHPKAFKIALLSNYFGYTDQNMGSILSKVPIACSGMRTSVILDEDIGATGN